MLISHKPKASILITKPGLKITSVTVKHRNRVEWPLPVPGNRKKWEVPSQGPNISAVQDD